MKEIIDSSKLKKLQKEALDKAKSIAGPRYSPELNIELPIAKVFDGLGRTKPFFEQIKRVYGEAKRAHSNSRSKEGLKVAQKVFKEIKDAIDELFAILDKIDQRKIERINFEKIFTLSKVAQNAAWICLEILRKTGSQNTKSRAKDRHVAESFGSERHNLYRLIELLQKLIELSESSAAILANNPFLLVTGDAGIGKTHLFCDVTDYRFTQDLPTILFLGEQFENTEPWSQIISLLNLQCRSKKELIEILNEAGKSCNCRTIIFIDALNEGKGKGIWKKYISKMIRDIKKCPYVALAINIRTGYERAVLTKSQIETFVQVNHPGFRFKEWEAVTKFFKHFNIKLPDVPLLTPEFQNPLFLKLFCQTYEGQEKFQRGHLWGTDLFEDYVIKMGDRICKEFGLPIGRKYKGKNIFWDLIMKKIAEWMGEKGKDVIHPSKVLEIIEEIIPGRSGDILLSMEKNWLLTKVPKYTRTGKLHGYVYRFPYNKFSDHLIVRCLLNKHLDKKDPRKSFRKSQKLGKILYDSWNHGIIETLSIQIPQRLKGTELFEIAPKQFDQSLIVKETFLGSLVWRDLSRESNGKPKFIKRRTIIDYINKHIIKDKDLAYKLLEVFLTIASIPEHPFNADFLHEYLMKYPLAKRDAFWSKFLHYQYGEKGSVDRLIEWAWSETDKSHFSDDSIRLCGVALTWFLTTSNRFLRDRTTKALVSLLTDRLNVIQELLQQFLGVNDPYVSERLYAVTYGVTLKNLSSEGLKEFVQSVYDLIFKDGKPPPHILLRDYARGVIEVALHKGLDMKINKEKIKPPYRSKWPRKISTKEELEKEYDRKGYWSIWGSVVGFGDFARYVIGTNSGRFNWSKRRLGRPRKPSKREIYEDFIKNLSQKQKKLWDEFHPVIDFSKIKVVLKKEDSKEGVKGIDEKKQKKEKYKTRKVFEESLSKDQLKVYKKIIISYENSPKQDEYQFDLSKAQRWIFKRVIDLGWTPQRFGEFDKFATRGGREAHKSERIGKKYQWIAYHEFLARVSDNFEFREDPWRDKQGTYNGPWQLVVRDIDPSCLIRVMPESNIMYNKCWWCPIHYDAWRLKSKDTKWLKTKKDLPSPEKIIDVKDNLNRQWLVLNGYMEWEHETAPEEEKYSIPQRRLWYMIKSYIVRKSEIDNIFKWAKKQNFWGKWMPEPSEFTDVFLREYPWAKAFLYEYTPYYGRQDWTRDHHGRLPSDVLVTTDQYLREHATHDCSIDESIRIKLPAKWIIDNMKLKQTRFDGEYADLKDNIIAFDPSVKLSGPGALLISKQEFIDFLDNNGYDIFWTVVGAKDIIGGAFGGRDWKGTLEISGAYRLVKDSLNGKITPQFETPSQK
ncbi:ATP-binding protein [candidate division WOR-3 bacterium]|nr:ATP-binding protein [candidate division WOR-3 bacterium]